MAAVAPARAVIVLGQIDDFEIGTTLNWEEGSPSPNPPTNVPTGGPAGMDDNYLQNVSSGGGGPGSRMVMFNQDQWAGDYAAAGVDLIAVHAANFGSVELLLRVTIFSGNSGTWFSSTTPFTLPADGIWRSLSFPLTDLALTQGGGSESLGLVLANVRELRILSSDAPDSLGASLAGTLGIDNIAAVPEPSTLLTLAVGAVLLALARRRRSAQPSNAHPSTGQNSSCVDERNVRERLRKIPQRVQGAPRRRYYTRAQERPPESQAKT
jgi:hypothetical protein